MLVGVGEKEEIILSFATLGNLIIIIKTIAFSNNKPLILVFF